MWDLPGHGEAPGRCSLGVDEADDLVALVERVAGDAPVALYGWSLGAGMSIAAAARDGRVAGVIAEAPYRLAITPARNVMRMNGLPYRMNLPVAMGLVGLRLGVGVGWRGFDRADLASRLACPLLVVHGSTDEICPIVDGREIAGAAPRGEIVVIEGAGHNDLWSEPAFAAACDGAIGRFLGRLG
jgi:pimeloyl-ACP methyl ester carboxylesterase